MIRKGIKRRKKIAMYFGPIIVSIDSFVKTRNHFSTLFFDFTCFYLNEKLQRYVMMSIIIKNVSEYLSQ